MTFPITSEVKIGVSMYPLHENDTNVSIFIMAIDVFVLIDTIIDCNGINNVYCYTRAL